LFCTGGEVVTSKNGLIGTVGAKTPAADPISQKL